MKRIYQYHVQVNRVIDGDTFEGTVDLGMNINIQKVRFRLLGVDTPERGDKGYYEATEFTANLIDGKDILVQSYDKDAFGRYLVDVFLEDHSGTLNDLLLSEGFAEVYQK
jgi:micrococcal nuclease